MTTTFRLNTDELDQSFIEKLKAMFSHEVVEICVTEFDETSEILRNPDDRERILSSIQHINNREGLIDFDVNSYSNNSAHSS